MNRGLKRVIITVAGIAMFTTTFTTTYADEIDSKLQTVAVQKRAEKLNSENLIVIEREVYKNVLAGDTAIIENKDNLLTIDSNNISEDELEIIKSSGSFYLFGTFHGDIKNLESLDNYASGLYGPTKYETALKAANRNTEQDIIFVNGASMVDYFIATQLGTIENKTVLLVEDELTKETKDYLVNHGSGKGISFVEGESKISEEVKNGIMKISGGERYELGKSQIIKTIKEKEEAANNQISKRVSESTSTIEKKDEDVRSKLIAASKTAFNKTNDSNSELIYNKGKIVTLENLETQEISEEKKEVTDLIKTVDNNLESTKVVNDAEIKEDAVKGYSLQITQAKPIEIGAELKEGKQAFLVPKETNDEIIQSVIDGNYGNEEARILKLTEEGYNAEDVQNKIEERLNAEAAEAAKVQAAKDEAAAEVIRQAQEAMQAAQAAQSSVTTYADSNYTSNTNTQASSSPQANSSQPVNSAVSASVGSASIESFINEAVKMEGWAYSQGQRMQNGFVDCSSLVGRAMANAGMSGNAGLTTHSMVSDSRFTQVPMSQMQRGDILWESDHMEIYMGGDSTFGAFRPGKPTGYAGNTSRFSRAYRINVNQ